MAAQGDDLRYFFSARLGDAVSVSVSDAGSNKTAAALAPGRYLVHAISVSPAGGRIWIRQGAQASVSATTAAPSFPLDAEGIRAIEVTVRPEAGDDTGIAARGESGVTATLIVTKISRD